LSEARRRALVYALRHELTVTLDRLRLLAFGRQWLYDRKLLVMREKDLRAMLCAAAGITRTIGGSLDCRAGPHDRSGLLYALQPASNPLARSFGSTKRRSLNCRLQYGHQPPR
jgi:hypothetical protein